MGVSLDKRTLVNRLINPDFEIWQRGTSLTSVSNGDYTADRWEYNNSGTMVHDVSRSTDVPTLAESAHLSNYSMLVDCTTAQGSLGASEFALVSQQIEGYNFKDVAQRSFVLSFWVKATKTGTYSVSFRNSGLDRSAVAEYTVNTTDTWEHKAVSMPGSPSAGTWDYENGTGMWVVFALASGSSLATSTLDEWQTGNFIASSNQVNACDSASNNFRLSQVQLESGDTAAPFQTRSFTDEVSLCQRYYCKSYPLDSDPNEDLGSNPRQTVNGLYYLNVDNNGGLGNLGGLTIRYPVEMRAAPSVVLKNYYTGNTNAWAQRSSGADETVSVFGSSSVSVHIEVNDASINNGTPNMLRGHWTADAEL